MDYINSHHNMIELSGLLRLRSDEGNVKWSCKYGQRSKMCPTRTNGYENDKATEFFRQL